MVTIVIGYSNLSEENWKWKKTIKLEVLVFGRRLGTIREQDWHFSLIVQVVLRIFLIKTRSFLIGIILNIENQGLGEVLISNKIFYLRGLYSMNERKTTCFVFKGNLSFRISAFGDLWQKPSHNAKWAEMPTKSIFPIRIKTQ